MSTLSAMYPSLISAVALSLFLLNVGIIYQPKRFGMLAMNGKLGRRLLCLIPVASNRLSISNTDVQSGPTQNSTFPRSRLATLQGSSSNSRVHQVRMSPGLLLSSDRLASCSICFWTVVQENRSQLDDTADLFENHCCVREAVQYDTG